MPGGCRNFIMEAVSSGANVRPGARFQPHRAALHHGRPRKVPPGAARDYWQPPSQAVGVDRAVRLGVLRLDVLWASHKPVKTT